MREQPPDYVVDDVPAENEGDEINGGASSWVRLLPCGTRVRKTVPPWDTDYYSRTAKMADMRNEIDIYNHLPKGHPRFLTMLASFDHGLHVGIDLPYLPNGTLRTYLERNHVEFVPAEDGTAPPVPVISPRLRARWAVEMADGIGFLHEHGIIHCDIKPHNMLLDDTLGVRIIDLAGSSLCGRRSYCCESDRFFMPRDRHKLDGTVTTDLFAVGMSLFEIVTGAQPYGEIADRREIRDRYQRGAFPSLAAVPAPVPGSDDDRLPPTYITKYMSSNPDEVGWHGAPANTSVKARSMAPTDASGRDILFAGAIRRCWHGQFASAADLLVALAEDIRVTFCDDDVAYMEAASGLSLRGPARPPVHKDQQLAVQHVLVCVAQKVHAAGARHQPRVGRVGKERQVGRGLLQGEDGVGRALQPQHGAAHARQPRAQAVARREGHGGHDDALLAGRAVVVARKGRGPNAADGRRHGRAKANLHQEVAVAVARHKVRVGSRVGGGRAGLRHETRGGGRAVPAAERAALGGLGVHGRADGHDTQDAGGRQQRQAHSDPAALGRAEGKERVDPERVEQLQGHVRRVPVGKRGAGARPGHCAAVAQGLDGDQVGSRAQVRILELGLVVVGGGRERVEEHDGGLGAVNGRLRQPVADVDAAEVRDEECLGGS
ncbi:hypothetical protein SPBR_04130 [Sporothrix brasiliensis 5110]|uniref:Protein kinase domain-containing protein n=1 Tax=Sporothrix brasiliensis 5110 TaxID=1398154 RepID=A0A0C2J3G0_9PEZI|nr:uncharacterized protein SPBR_04130 [Sporothrix brasiliensis 5110]KIH93560.1 hypothetical protein SPBR_04130 [Sporothrix brasiliensis 5110]